MRHALYKEINDIKSTFVLIAPIEYIISRKQFDALLSEN